jgi:biopolymer transport protein ExbB
MFKGQSMKSTKKIATMAGVTAAACLTSASAWAVETAPGRNPYGLSALWAQGDAVAKGTLIILVIMSLGTWYIGAIKFLEQAKLLKQGQEAKTFSWQTASLATGINEMTQESAFRFIAQSAMEAASKHAHGQLQRVSFGNWVEMTIQRSINVVNGRLQGGLPFLATVGSTAPFVGLFGTVWGIYHALTAIGMSGQASIDKVAGPVGEALIMTAIGLAVAVPAVLGYNWLTRRNKVAMDQLKHFSAELHMVLLSDR